MMARDVYLYGVVRRPSSKRARLPTVLGRGVGEPPRPVRLLELEDVAAVASRVDGAEIGEGGGIRGLRRDMAAHAEVLNRVVGVATVVPSRFGVVFPDEGTLIEEVLAPQQELLLDLLRRLRGGVEMSVTADFVEERVLREVVVEEPKLVGKRRCGIGGGSYQERIDLGRRLAEAIRARRDAAAQWLVDRLSGAAREFVVSEPRSDLNVLRASFLVDRREVDRFDGVLERVQREAGAVMRIDCVGPLPPYSFADVRIPVEVD